MSEKDSFDTFEFQCIQKIITHHFTKKTYPNLITDHSKQLYFDFLVEIDRYCKCKGKLDKTDNKEMKKDYFNWSFKDKNIAYEKQDQCMLESFSSHAIHTIYHIVLDTRMRQHLSLRIKHRFPASTTLLANELSVNDKFNCLEEKILKECSKIKSLGATYKCIQSVTNKAERFDKFQKSCPTFRENYKFSSDKQLI